MLEDVAANGNEDIVSWQPHGKAFRVHKPQEFAKRIMPRYFKQSHYKSFQRQLHIYGFNGINKKGMLDMGAYYHEEFIRGEKNQSLNMVRQKIKGPTAHYYPRSNGGRHVDPDFYAPKMYRYQYQGSPEMTSTGGSPDCTTRLALCSPPLDEGILLKPYNTSEELEQSTSILDLVNEPSQRMLSSNNRQKECYLYGDIESSYSVQSISGCGVQEDAIISSEPQIPLELLEGDEMFFAGKKFFFVDTTKEKFTPKRTVRRSSLAAKQE
jgi:hypothetical protein